MFQFPPASLASLLLPIRQTFDNITPKLKTRDIGSLFIALDRPQVQKNNYLATLHYFCKFHRKKYCQATTFFSVNNDEKDRGTWQKIMQELSSNEEHFYLFQDFISKVTPTFLILTAISELPYYARLRVKEVCYNIIIWVKNHSWW